ncbi:MAG: undecaprenyl diphosphate synthase family protein, partial [Candidatus Tectomicrobia bacterium]|nr:undecaprenyl diphosphate synthase family protein [Candidatus Tectomicrobia bacterium]
MMRFLNLLYHLYTKRLLSEIKRHPVPQHIGLILDGNRRYARLMGFQNIIDGHEKGADKIEDLLDWCLEVDVTTVTIWIF